MDDRAIELHTKMVDEDHRACYIVAGSKTWWLVQPRHYFWVDSERVFRARPEKRPESFLDRDIEEEIRSFRGGFPLLTSDNIEAYLTTMPEAVATTDEMRRAFVCPDLHAIDDRLRDLERHYLIKNSYESQETILEDDLEFEEYQMKLPSYYLSFNHKNSYSMFHETLDHKNVPQGWRSDWYDFGALIPSWDKYWIVDGVSYWSLTVDRF